MPSRHVPVRPNLDQLKHQAKDFLRDIRRGDPAAVAEFQEHHPESIAPDRAKLADAQLALARSYGVPSWPRLVLACRIVDAIWKDDVATLRAMVWRNPALLHEMARGTAQCNWGPPMSYAANLGRDRIIETLRELGATDVESALDRAVLQGQITTARKLHAMAGHHPLPKGAVMGPAESLNATGFAWLLELGCKISDDKGDWRPPVALVLETYSRNPADKHKILELIVQRGIQLPDTPPMAVHRGRIDLLEPHWRRDPGLLWRTFSIEEMFPPALGCHRGDEIHGTPLDGATLLHMCIDYHEIELASWLLDKGMSVDAKAAVDSDGFGGHTALFSAVVSFMHRICGRHPQYDGAYFARVLLDRGANPNARASLRKRNYDDGVVHEYHDVTPVSWANRYHDPAVVSKAATDLVIARGGRP